MSVLGLGLHAMMRNVGATFGRQLAAAILGLATMALIARTYGPEGMGTYSVALLLPTLLTTFLNLGVAPANVYHLGSGQVTVGTLLRINARIALWLTAIGLTIGAAVLAWHSELLFPGVRPFVLLLALATFPIALLNSFLLSVFQGLQQFREFNLVLVGQPTLLLLLVASLSLAGSRELPLLIVANLLAQLLMLAMAWSKLRPFVGDEPPSQPTPGFLWKTLDYGWKSHLSNILAFVNYRADMFIANLILGACV
jgi:O-antigen/teichoic acid export membrane protein